MARQRALDLASELGIPLLIMVSFIVDTGAGVNLCCYAPGLTTKNMNDLAMMSANDPVSSSKSTRVNSHCPLFSHAEMAGLKLITASVAPALRYSLSSDNPSSH